jgi:uncharacterized membrane protein
MSLLSNLNKLFKKKLFSPAEEERLMKAIKLAEQKTSGEIRVHIESKHDIEPVKRAQEVFKALNMHQTKERNGILFYLAIHSKQFAVWGDEGIHQKVSQAFWDEISEVCISNFKKDLFIEGLESAITLCGDKLKLHFPLQTDDTNELSDEISY